MSEIITPKDKKGGLYLGNLTSASDPNLLEMHNIKSVLTIMSDKVIAYDPILVRNHLFI